MADHEICVWLDVIQGQIDCQIIPALSSDCLCRLIQHSSPSNIFTHTLRHAPTFIHSESCSHYKHTHSHIQNHALTHTHTHTSKHTACPPQMSLAGLRIALSFKLAEYQVVSNQKAEYRPSADWLHCGSAANRNLSLARLLLSSVDPVGVFWSFFCPNGGSWSPRGVGGRGGSR